MPGDSPGRPLPVRRPIPKPDSVRQMSSAFIVSATRAAPTLLDCASTVVSSTRPRFEWSDVILRRSIVSTPGLVSMIECGVYLPPSSAADITNGLKLEPGSKMSVTARLR